MNQVKSKTKLAFERNIAMLSRWMHIYGSMISFAIVFFFSITGITLNHPDYFAGELKTTQEKGKLDSNWVMNKDTNKIAKLEIVEFLRKNHNIKAAVSEFRIDETQCTISFKGPGYAADAFINREDGAYELTLLRAGIVGIMNDLHKGRDTGSKWQWVIDISAVLLVLVSLTGMILILYIKRKKWSGLYIAIAGAILLWLSYTLFIP
ncbi:MAG: PepSY-associated TM helix domain-containing protein [Bacteroidota bacterium]